MQFFLAGAPSDLIHKQLIPALTDFKSWTDRSAVTKELMLRILKARSNVQELAAKYKFEWGSTMLCGNDVAESVYCMLLTHPCLQHSTLTMAALVVAKSYGIHGIT